MLAKKYRSVVVSIIKTIEGVYTIEFKSLSGKFKYLPGQFLHLAIDSEYDGIDQWPDSRCFSMQSNPDEENIKITYSVKGNFTKLMESNLMTGSEVWLKLPYGDIFLRDHDLNNCIFIAGGTGITPFLSLFTDKSFANYINPTLFVGFRDSRMNIYQNELYRACQINKNFEIIFFYENLIGYVDINMIVNKSYPETNFFISGPPLMIKNIKNLLIETNVLPSKIITDDWL